MKAILAWRKCALLRVSVRYRALLACVMALSVPLVAQQPVAPADTQPLSVLLIEAERNNPEIQAAQRGYEAAQETPRSAGALPDTEVTIQHFGVGSPKPGAGYSNSDFAYIGIGAYQQLPYPGKRRLRSEVAGHEADSVQADAEAVRRQVLESVKTAYFRLAYLQQALAILQRNDRVLRDIEQVTELRYRVGQSNQQEVLKAQLQRTKLLQDINMNRREAGQLQARLKQLLNRGQETPDILAEPLVMRALPYTSSQLLDAARQHNPEVRSREAMLASSQSRVELAHKEFRPDFTVQYMYENNDSQFRDYYVATFSFNLPNRGRRKAELAEAEARQAQAEQQLRFELQKQYAEVQDRYVFAQTSAEQLKIYREGLIPQAEATYRSALAAYQSNRQDFETLLNSALDVLRLEVEYQRELSEHESALARVESLTGVTLP